MSLFTSIRHRCLNYLDHLKIRNEYQEKILQKRDITGMLTWEYYVEAELRQHIETAIDHLPPQARKIFLMNRFDRKTAVTIAAELGLSPRTVEKHLEIALKNLKKELKDYLPATLLLWLFPLPLPGTDIGLYHERPVFVPDHLKISLPIQFHLS